MRKLLYIFFFFLYFNVSAKKIELPSESELRAKDYNELYSLANEISLEDIEAAKKVLSFAFEKAKSMNDKHQMSEYYRALGYIYEDYSQYTEATNQYLQALSIGEFTPDERIIVYNDIAIGYRKSRNYKKAKEYHLLTLEFSQANSLLKGIEFTYDGLGTLHYIAGDYDKAADYYLQSLSCSERRNSPIDMIITLKNLSEIYTAAKHNDLATQSIEKAYQLTLKQADKEATCRVLITYANTLIDMGRYQEAVGKINESLALVNDNQSLMSSKVNSLMTLGDVYYRQNDLLKAEEYFNFCLTQKDHLSSFNLARLYTDLGDIYRLQKNFTKAKSLYTQSLDVAQEYQILPLVQKSHQGLYELNKANNNASAALFHLELANNLRDSLNSEEKTKRIAELQFRYDLEHSEKEIQELKLKQSKFGLMSGLFATIVVILFLGYIIWNKVQNNKSLLQKHQEIEKQNKKLAESNEVLRQFAYASAHDLKEPLRNIGSFVSLIQRRFVKDMPEECIEYMGYVTTGVKKMNKLLEDLLAYSTLTMNNENSDKENTNIEDVVREIQQNLHSIIKENRAVIECENNVDAIKMSKLHTTQLLQNLISNGMKFVNGKTPVISINSNVGKNNKVLITVQDNGIGISQDYKEKVFHLFQRLHKNEARYEGTGVGLAICKNIVEKYNGEIWFESEENHGTKFFIELPMAA
jgi:signal transduction histidine kinase